MPTSRMLFTWTRSIKPAVSTIKTQSINIFQRLKNLLTLSLQSIRHRPLHALPLLLLLLGCAFLYHLFVPQVHPRLPGRTRSSFLIDESLFLPPPPPPTRPGYLPEPIPPKKTGMVVPDALHYVYGFKPVKEGEKADALPYYAYLAIRSAILHLKPAKIYFHYQHLPTGPWWDVLAPRLTLIKTVVPESYLGRQISHFAHQADVLRLLAMKHSGGIYLDIDMFVIKPFDDLLYFPTTLGMEASPDSRRTQLEPEGLCNAVIISAPHSPFIDRWLASYESFDEAVWAHHSVVVPWVGVLPKRKRRNDIELTPSQSQEIARSHPDEVQVLSSRAFFWPMWHGEEIQYTHENDDYDFVSTGQYAYHAWESLAMRYLADLSPRSIRDEDSSFHRLVRPFLGPDDDEIWREWKGEGR
ncbi:MAG: hypothetical protein TREMPRED_002999 [Tremellales sp. Tagirdzhanova-0007]|nr:MAG: hypothetical protein TREMPRED_002999 [Tremellales sp. Tagirdzhanova-0007]